MEVWFVYFGIIGILVTYMIWHTVSIKRVSKSLKHPKWTVRRRAVRTLADDLEYMKILDQTALITHLVQAHDDEDWRVRSETATILGRIKDIRVIRPLLNALRDNEPSVQENARKAVKEVGSVVHTIVFGSEGKNIHDQSHTLCDPDVSGLTVPLSKLKTIILFVAASDLRAHICHSRPSKWANPTSQGKAEIPFRGPCWRVIKREPHKIMGLLPLFFPDSCK